MDGPPSIKARWMRPTISTPHIQLSTSPISVSRSVDSWIALPAEESARCEDSWLALPEEHRLAEKTDAEGRLKPDGTEDEESDDAVGVTISDDGLFEVDVRNMELRSIYWKLNTPIKVYRATWMYDETRPAPKHIADQLDVAYKLIQPWQHSYGVELETAAGLGAEAHEKLRYILRTTQESNGSEPETSQLSVIFEDAFTAKITSGSLNQMLSRPLFGKARANTFNGTAVYRGYDAAVAARASSSSPRPYSPNTKAEGDAVVRDAMGLNVDKPAPTEEFTATIDHELTAPQHHKSKNITDLVLIVHGIGQGLATQYQAWDFLYSVNLFRQLVRKQATLPALASILRNKQVQFLPVQWRASLKIGEEEEREREREGLDNSFSIADITPRKTIPAIRELTNNVLIDVPYFLSRHQSTMIEAVCMQANRTYRRWCARNPGFETHGKVHIIGHSLGAVLASYILSKQPTLQPTLSQMDPGLIRRCRDRFLFNTSVLFLVGSPLPVFVHLNHAQIIARKGRERTRESSHDEALDREDIFGCLSVDSIYNIFNPSDPIAYLLNPCVDSEKAKTLPPSVIPTFNASFMSNISQRVTRLFNEVIPRSFTSSPPMRAASRTRSPEGRPRAERVLTSYELGGHQEVLQGTRAERRFAALNPHGTLDFQLTSEGSISEYVDMITAHSSYWQDPNFAAFILVELFANQEDLLRTGLVPAVPRS